MKKLLQGANALKRRRAVFLSEALRICATFFQSIRNILSQSSASCSVLEYGTVQALLILEITLLCLGGRHNICYNCKCPACI